MNEKAKSLLPIDCPCGCKDLQGDDGMKRHLTILGCMVFIFTLGLVALNSFQRDRLDNEASISSTLAAAPSGAVHAADKSMHNIDHPSNIYSFGGPAAETGSLEMAEQPQVIIPFQDPIINQLRHELPTHMTLAVTDREGKTRIKRIAGR